jgi:hypothetical protein
MQKKYSIHSGKDRLTTLKYASYQIGALPRREARWQDMLLDLETHL